MRFREVEDPFYHKQPECLVGDELKKPLYQEKPAGWGYRSAARDEAFICGVRVSEEFPCEKNGLRTVYEDFERFVTLFCLPGEAGYLFRTRKAETMETEAFRVVVGESECVIWAGDQEGIRRALYFLEDEMMRRNGPFLPLGEIERCPHIKRRITRNFFTPHEANKELMTEQDDYPDEYLNRLAHDGINGLWIFLQLRTLIPSEIVPEYGRDSTKPLTKLRQIARKCARYGIKVYGLGVEPASTFRNQELREKHADMLGAPFWGGSELAVCPSTEKGAAYIEECMYTLFTLVPELSGFISITLGEAVAGCGSVATTEEISCPHCRAAGLSKAGALAKTETLLKRGMQRAKPEAEFISWTYAMRGWDKKMQKEHCQVRDKEIPLMNNFEDRGSTIQLGRERRTLDYWLSFAGPGEIFKGAVLNAGGAPIYAKLQVCCSHELATVPYVPVPGILYNKYQEMLRMGTEGAMYCWFFGNYPSIMNKAAGELGFLPFPETKEEFLHRFALLYTNEEGADALASAWSLFEKSYSLCPYNVAFAWFGPLNDAPVRPLHLLPIDTAVPSNWLLSDTPEGDRFGEFTGMGHTPEEACTLLSEMNKYWKEGLALLDAVDVPQEMRYVAQAISILIASAENVLSFYLLRNQLGYGEGEAEAVLKQMSKIAEEEIRHSEELAAICEKDNRLGFHSEAVGYKFFPEKLRWRVERLRGLLNTEFPEVADRILERQAPLAFFEGKENPVYALSEGRWENFIFKDGETDGQTAVRMYSQEKEIVLEIAADHEDTILIDAEFRMFIPYVPVRLCQDGSIELEDPVGYYLNEERRAEEKKKWAVTRKNGVYTVVFDKESFGLFEGKPFRLAIRRSGEKNSAWKQEDRVFPRLMYGRISPDEKVFIR